ncbi:hemerythrin domain-containing protein [Thermomonospora cellulosilytica]|uniref:Hemerythrin superfamily protein n=1 Tax=Thermomonospora cellulosilytica TaxID=1411118 RepID=A0A7W3N032_9ACTN|nr:hemerythrin domain-containing protein [Thermomonospora cellulosilytica]MBA9005066.1 hemerythrin superfamily protein [Thermomonospora cellulosilytica]
MAQAPTLTKNDVIDLLVAQHAQIRDLFAETLESTGDRRKDAFRRLVRLLAVHETAEEEIVHPVARRSLPGGEGIVDDRLREEREAKELLAELDGMDVHDPQFLPKLDKLRIAVLTHARSEERYEFYRLVAEFSDTQRAAMARAVKAAEATAPTHPHPGTESATANVLVGPLASMVDRIRDIIRKD